MTRHTMVCARIALLTLALHATAAHAQVRDHSAAAAKAADGGNGSVNGPSLKGSGTPGQLALWLDERTLGNSAITQLGDLLGIGTIKPDSKVTVVQDAEFAAVVHAINVGAGGVAFWGEGADRTDNQLGGEGVLARGGNSQVFPGDGVLTAGGNGPNRGGFGVNTHGGIGLVTGGAGIVTNGGPSAGSGHTSGDGIIAAPGMAFNGATRGRAGVFMGDVSVTGMLTKAGGSFKIDHPLDPANRYLSHSFVESPDMMNVYNGNVTTDGQGLAIVELPEWFEALNKDFRYQLTVIGTFAQAMIAEKIAGNRFAIRTSQPNVEVSWQVTGIRRDPWAERHRVPVDEEKPGDERGRYLHPELYDQPADSVIPAMQARDRDR